MWLLAILNRNNYAELLPTLRVKQEENSNGPLSLTWVGLVRNFFNSSLHLCKILQKKYYLCTGNCNTAQNNMA